MTIAKGINNGLRVAMEKDSRVVLMGEDIGKLGGVFRVTDGLQKDFGEDRVIDTPLAEAGIVGNRDRHGAARVPPRGRDPVRRLHLPGVRPHRQPGRQDAGTIPRQGQAADGHPHPRRRRHRCGRAPLRVQRGLLRPHGGPEGRLLLQRRGRLLDDPAGHRDRRPGALLRAQARYWDKGEVDETAAPRELLKAQVCRTGTDATLVAYGPMVKTCLQAAEAAEGRGQEPGGHRPAHAVAARHGRPRGIGGEDGPHGGCPRGVDLPRPWRRGCRLGDPALLLQPRGARDPGRRLQPALPAEQARGGVPPRPRPGARPP